MQSIFTDPVQIFYELMLKCVSTQQEKRNGMIFKKKGTKKMTNFEKINKAKTVQEIKDVLFEFETELRFKGSINYEEYLSQESDEVEIIKKRLAVVLSTGAENIKSITKKEQIR